MKKVLLVIMLMISALFISCNKCSKQDSITPADSIANVDSVDIQEINDTLFVDTVIEEVIDFN